MQTQDLVPHLDDRLATPSSEDLGDLLDFGLDALVVCHTAH
jgi:hypothetical protein